MREGVIDKMKLQIYEGLLQSRRGAASNKVPVAALPYIERTKTQVDEPYDRFEMPEEKKGKMQYLEKKYQKIKRFSVAESHKNEMFKE